MTAAAPAQARPPGPSTRVSVIVLVLGVVLGGFGLYAALAPLFRTLLEAPGFPTPGQAELHLSSGRYLIYQRTGSSGFGISESGPTTLTPSDVTVTSPTGERLDVEGYTSNETITRNGSGYTSALEFDAPESGLYIVYISAPGSGRVIVARPLGDTVRKSLKWWGLVAMAAIAVITGTVMWIVGASRRRRLRLAYGYYAPATPAGWYPDPQQPGRMRYWNGSIWTEHTN